MFVNTGVVWNTFTPGGSMRLVLARPTVVFPPDRKLSIPTHGPDMRGLHLPLSDHGLQRPGIPSRSRM